MPRTLRDVGVLQRREGHRATQSTNKAGCIRAIWRFVCRMATTKSRAGLRTWWSAAERIFIRVRSKSSCSRIPRSNRQAWWACRIRSMARSCVPGSSSKKATAAKRRTKDEGRKKELTTNNGRKKELTTTQRTTDDGRRTTLITDQEIRDFCRAKLAHFKVPRYVKFVDHFPQTVTGKIQKFKIREAVCGELGLSEELTA